MRIAGFVWSVIWLLSGTYLFAWLTLNHLEVVNAVLPLIVIAWCVLLFVGHSVIDRLFKKSS